MRRYLSFNSLQTGTRIARLNRTRRLSQKRSFNSLQTGKRIASIAIATIFTTFSLCFNSLQTGKRIASCVGTFAKSAAEKVSIPFKRERGSQESESAQDDVTLYEEVSIPFKRESGSQGKCQHNRPACRRKFQFPSNGKADRKRWIASRDSLRSSVSIPFKRESGSQAGESLSVHQQRCFNSLQTGKRIASKEILTFMVNEDEFQFPSNGKADRKSCRSHQRRVKRKLFQFPSNGKADRKLGRQTLQGIIYGKVSIPFKRERGSKGTFEDAPVIGY